MFESFVQFFGSIQRLQSLQAGQNKFVCSCDFVDFFQSVMKGSGDVHLTDREEMYICDSPLYLQGGEVGQVHRSIVECHQVLFVSVSCGVVLLVLILLSVLLWRLHAIWYLKMTWAWLKAKRKSRQRRCKDRDAEALLSFDAFVSYSERDASWVENFLVPELEEPRLRPNFLSNITFLLFVSRISRKLQSYSPNFSKNRKKQEVFIKKSKLKFGER